MTSTTTTRVARITFEADTCGRCGGTGSMPFAAYGGMCLKCNRRGVVLTPKGLAASRKAAAWTAANTAVAVSDLKVGDRIYVLNMRNQRVAVTVQAIGPSASVTYLTEGEQVAGLDITTVDAKGNETVRGHQANSTATYQRVLTQDDLQALAAHLARNSGAIVTYAEVQA